MNKPSQKKMNYSLDITRRVPNAELIRDGGTEKKAKALKGTWIKLNPELFAFVEEAKTTIVETTKTTKGCGCKTFIDSDLTLLCEHLIAFDDLKEPPQLMIYSDQKVCRVLTEYLFTLGWYTKDRWLYPSLDSPTRLDPMHEEKELDLGLGETVSASDIVTGEATMVHYTCPKCGEEVDVEKDKLTDWKLNHMEVCKGKPAKQKIPTTNDLPKTTKSVDATSDPEGESNEGDDPTPNNPPEKTPVPKPGMMSTKCEWCGEKIERELAVDLAQALDEHKKTCPKRPTDAKHASEPNHDATHMVDDLDMSEPEDVIIPAERGSIINIAKAMCKVQQTELFAILNADNPFVKSKYADLSSVWAAIRKPITDNGLSVIQTTEPYEGGITVVTTLMHVSGETLTTRLSTKVPEKLPDKNKQEQSNIQSLGSAITYLRRYSLAAMIGVCPTDDDGESVMGRGGK